MADGRRRVGITPLTDDRDTGAGPPDVPGVNALVRIDNGGVCTVFRGRQVSGGRGVAVKVLPAPFDRAGWAMFDREQHGVRRLAELPTVLQIDQVGQLIDGRPYLVSELCAESCEQRVALDGALPREGVIDLGAEMSDALARIHALGVIHGAVTPHNVLFRRSGQAVLGDVGLAARQAYQGDLDYIGEYAAPETLRSGIIDERSDLYGLGTVLFLAVTGRPPFPARIGEHAGERVLRMLAEPAPPVDVSAAGPELAALIDQLLATDPDDRVADAAEAADRLAAMAAAIPRGRQGTVASDDVPAGFPSPAPTSMATSSRPSEPVAGPTSRPPSEPTAAPTAAPTPDAAPNEQLADLMAMTANGPAASETSTDWSDLLDDVLCETGADTAPRRRGSAHPTFAEPPEAVQEPTYTGSPDDLSAELTSPRTSRSSGRPGRRAYPERAQRSRSRSLTLLGGVAAIGVLLIGVVDVVGADSDDSPAKPAAAPTTSAPATVPAVDETQAVQVPAAADVRLLSARSTGRSVQLRWAGDESLEFVVLLWQPGQPSSVVFADHRTAMTVSVAPGRPYCFRVQATGGDQVIESKPIAIMGATCR